jgi:hypothetical protein
MQWAARPLRLIMIIALVLRLTAALFSKGYAMHDDHFLIIEAAQSWVDGKDYSNWLPWSQIDPVPEGHSFFYVGLHFILFSLLKFLGITNPEFKMFVVRLIHALFSMIVVYYGYKITEKLYHKDTARKVGLVLATLWFMPFLSVRNLNEMVCIPFMIFALWMIINVEKYKNKYLIHFIAGLIVAFAFSVRFQSIIFIGGMGLVLLLQKKWKEFLWFGLGNAVTIMLVEGLTDLVFWGYPFAQFIEYFRYNIQNSDSYFVAGWYAFINVILAMLVPPLSIMLFIGFFRAGRKYLIVFLPTFLYLLFHSIFPNKQERFIFSIIPFFIIAGFIGWDVIVAETWLNNKTRLLKTLMIIFWIGNLCILPFATVTYTKKARIEAMKYLSKYDNIDHLMVETTATYKSTMMPQYYLKNWVQVTEISQERPLDTFRIDPLKNLTVIYDTLKCRNEPQFILFLSDRNLYQRVASLKEFYPKLEYETMIKTGFVDRFMHWLNRVNNNEPVYIYRTRMGSPLKVSSH